MYGPSGRQLKAAATLCFGRWLLVVLLGALLAGCTSPPGRFSATRTPTPDCGMLLTCQVVLPRCGTPVTTPQQSYYWWGNEADYRLTLPGNVQALVGFEPLLPATLPFDLSLYRVVVFGPSSAVGHLLLHIAYIDVQDRVGRGWPYTVLGLDESVEALGPLDDLNLPNQPLQVDYRAAARVNGQPATLYHVISLSVPAGAYELIWKAGSVTIRLIVAPVQQGVHEEDSGFTPPVPIDVISPWVGGGDDTGAKDTTLLAFAPHVAPFTRCG